MMKTNREVTAIIGLGYVGLPLSLDFCAAGLKVIGFDTDDQKVKLLQHGGSYISYIPDETVFNYLNAGLFEASNDFSRLGDVDNIIITVPTPLNEHREPELKYVRNTAAVISQYLKKGQLIVLESTTFPGTSRDIVLPILEKSGLNAGEDFFIAYSPERVDPNNKNYRAGEIPKVVGGYSLNCLKRVQAFYGTVFSQLIPVSSLEAAEASKLLENIFRAINIALVNEMKMLFDLMGIDIWEIIEASSTKPFGFMPFYPGPGLGGHCIPIDPFYLTWKAREYDFATRFIELAGEINSQMPYYVVQKMTEALNLKAKSIKGSAILILGAAYKKDIDDIRESPAVKIISLLQDKGAVVSYHDPYVPIIKGMRSYPALKMESIELTEEILNKMDCVTIVTDHSCLDYRWILANSQMVIDTRNASKGLEGTLVIKS